MCHWMSEHDREQVRPVPLERFGANPTRLDTSGATLATRAPFFIDLMDHRAGMLGNQLSHKLGSPSPMVSHDSSCFLTGITTFL